jgi:hypothetical protein
MPEGRRESLLAAVVKYGKFRMPFYIDNLWSYVQTTIVWENSALFFHNYAVQLLPWYCIQQVLVEIAHLHVLEEKFLQGQYLLNFDKKFLTLTIH